jgi:hypothetical protein
LEAHQFLESGILKTQWIKMGSNWNQMFNALIAYENIHYLKRKKGKSGACVVKLDMAKAYDRVEWTYLRQIMLQMGFSANWINLIMRCVESVKLSVRINDYFSKPFSPSRGIRQGDPLSPYLSLMCRRFVLPAQVFWSSVFD